MQNQKLTFLGLAKLTRVNGLMQHFCPEPTRLPMNSTVKGSIEHPEAEQSPAVAKVFLIVSVSVILLPARLERDS